MLKKKDIYSLSRIYSISEAAISQFLEVLLFQGKKSDEDLLNSLKTLLKLIKMPLEWYSMRINLKKYPPKNESNTYGEINNIDSTLKMQIDSIRQKIGGKDAVITLDPLIPNNLYFKVQGPFKLRKLKKSVTIDRIAAESVMLGANLYIPGFLPQKLLYNFEKNEEVSVFSPGNYHVANGFTRIKATDLTQLYYPKKGIGIETTDSVYKMARYRDSTFFTDGILSDMGFSPNLAIWALMSKYLGDEKILDVCSAPGHKTCAMSEVGYYLQNGISPEIFSVDRSKKRLLTLKREISRLKLENIYVINSKIQTLGEKNPELLDAVDFCVFDPPCSALGTRPKLIIEKTHEDFRNFFLLQRNFLKHIDKFIKSGGYLLYNTCSLSLLENEGIIFYAIDRLGYKLISIRKTLEKIFPGRFSNEESNLKIKTDKFTGKELNSGISIDESILDDLLKLKETNDETSELLFKNIEDIQKYARLNDAQCKKVVRTYPSPNTNGYFFALMQKS